MLLRLAHLTVTNTFAVLRLLPMGGQEAPLRPVPDPITNPGRITDLNIRRRDRLGGILFTCRLTSMDGIIGRRRTGTIRFRRSDARRLASWLSLRLRWPHSWPSGPYDLRHAAVSLWLNVGVPAPRFTDVIVPAAEVAQRAGHSVEALQRVYAKCVEGQALQSNNKITSALDD